MMCPNDHPNKGLQTEALLNRIIATLEAVNPSKNRHDTANEELATAIAGYVFDTYHDPNTGYENVLAILSEAKDKP